jgi:hypothetical protein
MKLKNIGLTAFLVSLSVIMIVASVVSVGSLTQQTPAPSVSTVTLEGFQAINRLRARVEWGRFVAETEVEPGLTSVSFNISEANVRSPLSISLEPEGLTARLEPTAFGYELKAFSIGRSITVLQCLRIVVKELVMIVDVEISIKPSVRIGDVLVNGKSAVFLLEEQGSALRLKLLKLIVDLMKPLEISVTGNELSARAIIKRTTEEGVIDVNGEFLGNISAFNVKVLPSRVLASQVVEIPIKLLNVSEVVERYSEIVVDIHRGNATTVQEDQYKKTVEPKTPETLLTQLQQLMEFLATYRPLIFMSAVVLLVVAFVLGKRLLALASLLVFALYFLSSWWGGQA